MSDTKVQPGDGHVGADESFVGGFRQIDVNEEVRRPGITVRAVAIAFAGITLIALLEPYNFSYKFNASLIGNHFPMSVAFILLFLILLANPVLKLLHSGWQFASSELIVIFGMIYTACCIPGAGLMRYWMMLLTRGFFNIHEHPEWQGMFDGLPAWLFPSRDPKSPIVDAFWRGLDESHNLGWFDIARAWLTPFLAWGIFFFAVFLCMWSIAVLVRKQWVENEKLSFPLAQVALEIIRPPRQGRLLNELFRNRILWLGVGIVVVIHALAVLNANFPNIPAIPIAFNKSELFANFPWNHIGWYVKGSQVYFTAIGLVYFVTTRCSFSLWFFPLLLAALPVLGAQLGQPINGDVWRFHFFGAMIVLMVSLAWVARAHFKIIWLAFIGRHKEPRAGRYMSYRAATILFAGSFIVAVVWLQCAGMQFYYGIPLLIVLLMIFVTMARVVAETGLFFVHTYFQPLHVTQMFDMPILDHNSFLIGAIASRHYFDTNETHGPYAVNALRIADGSSRLKHRGRLIPLFVIGMALAYFVAAVSMGWCAYNYGALDFRNTYGATRAAADYSSTINYVNGTAGLPYDPRVHTLIGAGVMALLAFARYRWVRWPLYPIGWLLSSTWAMQAIWFSIMIGWMLKAVILKFGGSILYNRLKPLFIGLILGEVIAGGITATLVLTGTVDPYKIMPT